MLTLPKTVAPFAGERMLTSGVGVGDGAGVGDGLPVGPGDGVGAGVGVAVGNGVEVGAGVGVGEAIGVGVGVGGGVGVGVDAELATFTVIEAVATTPVEFLPWAMIVWLPSATFVESQVKV